MARALGRSCGETNGAGKERRHGRTDERGERGLDDSGFDDPVLINRALDRPALVEPAAEGRRSTEAIVKALAPAELTREDADPAGERFALSASDEFSADFLGTTPVSTAASPRVPGCGAWRTGA